MPNNKKHKYYHKKPKKNPIENIQLDYPVELLTKPISEINLSESTFDLLSKNKISVCGDLVMRTEKDMYKIQGLNKKILLEVINSLSKFGLELRPIPEQIEKSSSKQISNNDKPQQINKDKQNDIEKPQQINKFGLAEKVLQKDNKKTTNNLLTQVDNIITNEIKKFIKGGKWGFIKGSKILVPPIYDEVFLFKEDLSCVEIDEKCGFIDINNNIVIPIEYDLASSFSEGLAMVCKNNKCGYINKNNELVIPFSYDAATQFENGEAKVKKDGKWATIDTNNNLTWII